MHLPRFDTCGILSMPALVDITMQDQTPPLTNSWYPFSVAISLNNTCHQNPIRMGLNPISMGFWACDSDTIYPLRAAPYLGKELTGALPQERTMNVELQMWSHHFHQILQELAATSPATTTLLTSTWRKHWSKIN